MSKQYRYDIYRPLQVPGHLNSLSALTEDGWTVINTALNYGEVQVLMEREAAPNGNGNGSSRRKKAKPEPEDKPESRPAEVEQQDDTALTVSGSVTVQPAE